MNPYTIITIAAIWAIILIISIVVHQSGIHKKNKIEKNLTERIDTLRHDAFIQHKDFDAIAKKRLKINQTEWYTHNRASMESDVTSIRWEQTAKSISIEYKKYEAISWYARIGWIIANICSIGIYRLLA